MSTFWRQAGLAYRMAYCDYKMRDQGTFLGFLWTLLNPFLMFAVLYLLCSSWFSQHTENYGVYLFLGLIHWNFFALSTGNSLSVLERKRHLLKHFDVDAAWIVLCSNLSIFASYLVEVLLVLIGIALWIGPTSLSGYVWFFATVVMLFLFSLGVSLILAHFYIFFRDVQHIWGILLRIGFFVTPVFYPIAALDARKLAIVKLNPLAHIFSYSREAILSGQARPDIYFGYVLAFLCSLLLASTLLFQRNGDELIEHL